jgi:uncharacterized protein (DUF1684 family)
MAGSPFSFFRQALDLKHLSERDRVYRAVRMTIRGHSFLLLPFLPFLAILAATACQKTKIPSNYVAEILKERQDYNQRLRADPYSALALVYRQYLKDSPRLTIGSSDTADVRLVGEDIAPVHAVIEGASLAPTLRAQGAAVFWSADTPPRQLTQLTLNGETKFRIGRFPLLYRINPPWGRTLEVFDPETPAFRDFTEVEFFPIDPAYRVPGEVIPYQKPEQVILIDSQGLEQPWWLYGDLRFRLQGVDSRLELYTLTLDPEKIHEEGFMLIFTDATSGNETFPGTRYLYVEGKMAGTITVDFNRAFNPPCIYSPVYTCAFPRPQNRLPVAIRAGALWYRK